MVETDMANTGQQDWRAFIVAAFELIRAGHPNVARQKAKQALYAARQLVESHGHAILLCEAVLAYLRRRLHRAEHFFELATQEGKNADRSLEHEVFDLFAETKFLLGKYGASADLLIQAISVHCADIALTSSRLRRLARIYTILGEDELARAYYKQAQRLSPDANGGVTASPVPAMIRQELELSS
jgi:tetratricopeptide (TPR) repeat protein